MRFSLPLRKRAKTRKKQLNKIGAYSAIFIAMLIMPALLVIGVEYIQRGTLHAAMDWMNHNHPLFYFNYMINLCLALLIYCILGSLTVSLGVTSFLLFTISLISYFKMKMIGEPFVPWDVLLKKESMNISQYISSSDAKIKIAMLAAIVLGLFLLRIVVPRLSIPWKSRIVLGLLSMFMIYSVAFKTSLGDHIETRLNVSEIAWDQQQNYTDNGLSAAFTMNVKNAVVRKPLGYDKPAIQAVAQDIVRTAAQQPVGEDPLKGKKPNVIFVMNEAFWDPTLLPGVTFSEDPIPTVHRLQKESTSGYLLSPQFGGGTSNVEFEVLTGYSMSFLPGGSIPYQQYINKPTPTLASFFEGQGYKSMGIHPYEGWFWDRKNVYEKFGFESFKYKELFTNPEVNGFFISDAEVTRSIIDEVDNTQKPMFIYAVTMQNHGPYDTPRYPSNPIKAAGNLTVEAKNVLETYTHGAHDADKALSDLIAHYEKSNEPTVVIFYGDHLPMLGPDYDVYKQTGFVHSGNPADWSLEELKKIHSVPFVMWSNFNLPKQTIPTLSNSFLGGNVLDALHLEKPAQFAVSDQLSQKLPGMLSNLYVDSNQNLSSTVPDEMKQQVSQYRDVQYDLLFGKKFLADFIDSDFLNRGSLPNFNEEFIKKEATAVNKASPQPPS
jgi:phosphoglycerol transferase MdoB-like AlkP superfamily enzyme